MRTNGYLDDKITCRAAVSSLVTLIAKSDSLSVVNTCGNGYLKLFIYLTIPLPLQLEQGFFMILPVPLQSGHAAVDCIIPKAVLC